ncbi:hypothetical protein FBQ81_18195 [Chloroflexi bacterium CFX6]|nr:hypothetical protein [Chloroflexi bacterium CFX6]
MKVSRAYWAQSNTSNGSGGNSRRNIRVGGWNSKKRSALESVPGLRLYGLTDSRRLEERVATFSFRLKDLHPRLVADPLVYALGAPLPKPFRLVIIQILRAGSSVG